MSTFGKFLIILGVIIFLIGSATGTITGYQGADGQYYSNPDAVGSREWMCGPALCMVVVGYVLNRVGKDKK